MPKVFYLSEIVTFAIEKEMESIDLYSKLANECTNEQGKVIFALLLQEEKKHKAFYEGMLAEYNKEQPPGSIEGMEYLDYMQELISASRNIKPLSITELSDIKKAVDFAIGREKDSILFYYGLKNFIKDLDKPTVDTIIQEESKHVALLSKLKLVL